MLVQFFTTPYLWFFIVGYVLTMHMLKLQNDFGGASEAIFKILQWLPQMCALFLLCFLIVGFFQMPHWFYPFGLMTLAMAVNQILPLSYRVCGLIGIIGAPLAIVLCYTSLL